MLKFNFPYQAEEADFRYRKEQVELIYQLLENNQNDVVKVFGCVWDGPFKDEPRTSAHYVLRLIERVHLIIRIEGGSFENVWDAMTRTLMTPI